MFSSECLQHTYLHYLSKDMYVWFKMMRVVVVILALLLLQGVSPFTGITLPVQLKDRQIPFVYVKGERMFELAILFCTNNHLALPEAYYELLISVLDEALNDPIFDGIVIPVNHVDVGQIEFSQQNRFRDNIHSFIAAIPDESIHSYVYVEILEYSWNFMEKWVFLSDSIDLNSFPMHTFPDLTINNIRYKELTLSYAEEYQSNDPFPHAVFDGLYPIDFVRQVASEFPQHAMDGNVNKSWIQSYHRVQNLKLGCTHESCMGPATRHLISHMKSETFIEFLEGLTGIPRLIADPKYFGSGMHQTQRGGHLNVHTDFTHHDPLSALWRRVNVFLYMNEDWNSEEWGGSLELWDKGALLSQDSSSRSIGGRVAGPTQVIPPLLNRLVIFSTSNSSFHGHPQPLTCPSDVTRKSIALYYYTLEPPPVEYDSSVTRWFTVTEEGLSAIRLLG